jgi:hypothetical protein
VLPAEFVVFAIALRLAGGASYVRATLKGEAQPSIISWSFWSLTALIAFAVQIAKGSGPEAFVTLAIGLSPLAVCMAAVYKGTHRLALQRSDKWCIALTMLGIVLWLVSSNPILALFMSVFADISSSVPTILKCYRDPGSEHLRTYVISIASMTVTLLTITDWRLTHWLFPAYILGINCTYCIAAGLSKLRLYYFNLQLIE